MKWQDCKYHDDMDDILDMAGGADGGVSFIRIRAFLMECEEKGEDVPFVRQFAKLCRVFTDIEA